eukprot:349276-Hanusia_phi.AAC.1
MFEIEELIVDVDYFFEEQGRRAADMPRQGWCRGISTGQRPTLTSRAMTARAMALPGAEPLPGWSRLEKQRAGRTPMDYRKSCPLPARVDRTELGTESQCCEQGDEERWETVNRELQAFCNEAGLNLDLSRRRKRAAERVLEEYDSDEDVSDRVLHRLFMRIKIFSGEIPTMEEEQDSRRRMAAESSKMAGQHHDRPGQLSEASHPSPKARRDEPQRGEWERKEMGGREEEERREEGRGRDTRRSEGEDRDVCTPVLDKEAMWKPSEYRYGGKSPTERTHDALMPRRPRGEVDEWAALQQLQDEAAVRGEQGWKEQRRQEQRDYMEYIQQQMEERKRNEEGERREKRRELEDAQKSFEVLREEEQRSKQKQKEEASRVKQMYDRQLRDRDHALRVERDQRRRSEVEYLAMIQEEEKGRKRADAERREQHIRDMMMMKDSVDKQMEDRRRMKMVERQEDRRYAEQELERRKEHERSLLKADY